MVAYAPYVAGTAALSSVIPAPTYPAGYNVTSTISTLDYCKAATVTVYEYVDEPTSYPTAKANEKGGLYYNPYNDLPPAFDWPGTPHGDEPPAPIPESPYEYGGPAKDDYEAPCWIPKGQGKLKSSLPKGKQNGGSKWGEIDCPHLPVDGLPEYSYPPIYTTSKSSSAYPPYPTDSYPTGSYSANHTSSGTGYHSSGTGYSSSGTGVTASTSYSSSVSISTGVSSSSSTPAPACPTMPDTGVTRTYEFDVAYQTIAPDGVTRNGLTVNGQFPGPLVEANWGDWLLFKVKNSLGDEGTAIHAHGLFQTETSWYDGVPAVAQCPIIPDGSLEMLFRADRYGTSWWHSHFSAQYSGGAHGPMVIYGPKHAEYDIDIGPVVLEDWFHADYFSLVNRTMFRQFPPSNNVLINGKMNYPCQNTTLPCEPNAGVSKFKFESGKKHLLRLINAGAEGVQKFSIDGHKLTVTAVDFIPVEPYETDVVTLSIGQRTDVVVEAIGEPGDAYWMRSALGTNRCTLNDGISNVGVAAVYYEDADTDSVPSTTTQVTAEQIALCQNDPLDVAIPLCPIAIEEDVPVHRIDFSFKSNGTFFVWYVGDEDGEASYRGNYNEPILLNVREGKNEFEPQWNVKEFPGESSVRLHLVNSGLIGGHPMHLHGHDFHVLAEGHGEWDGTITNPENSVRRDVHTLQNAHNTTGTVEPSFIVIQFTQDNPGVWPLHCHLAWHVSGGLFLNILERPEDILKQEFDEDVFEGCTLWDAYSALNPPNQIDSGL